jgi:probable F420-dependent oxidoreductase
MLSVSLSHVDHITGGPAGLFELARVVEAAGADQVALNDHLALAEGSEHELLPDGRPFGHPATETYPDPLVELAALAAVTTTIRLSTNILVAPLRSAVVLAKAAATVDVLSGGRLDLGVGAGWHRPEFDVVGAAFDGRGRGLDECIRTCRSLWSGDGLVHNGTTIHSNPLPARIPIWVGGAAGPATIRRVAELGDGWSPSGRQTVDELRAGIALLRAACADQGRSPDEVGVRCTLPVVRDGDGRPDLRATLDAVPAVLGAGVTIVQLPALHFFATDIRSAAKAVEAAADAVRATVPA